MHFSGTKFKKGDLLMHFDGELIVYEEAIRQQEANPESEATFLFFKHEDNSLW